MVNFNELISTGDKHLFIIKKRGKNGYYAECLEHARVKYLSDFTSKIVFLSDENIICYTHQITLNEVFEAIKKNQNIMPDFRAPKEDIKSFFRLVAPTYNEKRVLIKSLRKVIYQFNMIARYEENKKNTESLMNLWVSQEAIRKSKALRCA